MGEKWELKNKNIMFGGDTTRDWELRWIVMLLCAEGSGRTWWDEEGIVD